MNLETLDADRVEEVLERHGALAITYSDAADDPVLEPLPGETPLWRDSCVTGLFAADADVAALTLDLRQSLHRPVLPPYRVESLDDRAWEREWLNDFKPMRFGQRLWVFPVDAADTTESDEAIIIRLDPGLAFGTGTHATTALCLERLDGLPLTGTQVLDYGCGSGILAIGALLLGAAHTTGYDIDPQAVTATMNNARQNRVDIRLSVTLERGELDAGYDVVVANILAKPLIELAGEIGARVKDGGTLILSGILEGQAETVAGAYADRFNFDRATIRDGWACLSGTRRPATR